MSKISFRLPKGVPDGSILELTVAAKISPGVTTAEIAKELGITRQAVFKRANALGLQPVNEAGQPIKRGKGKARTAETWSFWWTQEDAEKMRSYGK